MDSKASLDSKDCNSILSPNSPLFQPIDTLTQTLLETNSCPYLPKLYGIYKSVEEIDFKSLPQSFVLKTNHDCGGVVLVPDKEAFLADSESFNKAMEKLTKHLSINYATLYRERHYEGIEPRVFAEELLGDSLQDFRFHCFGGEVRFIQVANATHTHNTLFSPTWEKLDITYLNPPSPQPIPRPDKLDSMLDISYALSSPINYVRVDLYTIQSRIFVGELTFTPNGGTAQFQPSSYDLDFGTMWQ